MFPFKFHWKWSQFEILGLLERVFIKDLFENERRKRNFSSVDSDREQSRQTFKFNKINYCYIINASITKMHCQQFTLKYITLAYQIL